MSKINKKKAIKISETGKKYLPYLNKEYTYSEIATALNVQETSVRDFVSTHNFEDVIKKKIDVYRELLNEGYTLEDIAIILDINLHSVKVYCYNHGLILTRKKEYIELLKKGKTFKEIADYFQINIQSVKSYISNNKLTDIRKMFEIKKELLEILFISECPKGHRTNITTKLQHSVNGKHYYACKDSECLTYYQSKVCITHGV